MNLVEAELEEKEEQNAEELLEGAEIAEEEGDFVNCVVQHVLCSAKIEDPSQRNNIFKSC